MVTPVQREDHLQHLTAITGQKGTFWSNSSVSWGNSDSCWALRQVQQWASSVQIPLCPARALLKEFLGTCVCVQGARWIGTWRCCLPVLQSNLHNSELTDIIVIHWGCLFTSSLKMEFCAGMNYKREAISARIFFCFKFSACFSLTVVLKTVVYR